MLALDALSDEQREELTSLARIEIWSEDDEIPVHGLALLLQGAASVHAGSLDIPATRLNVGDVVYPEGTLPDALYIRAFATETPTKVATWTKDVVDDSLGPCPGLLDELRQASDRVQALAGATMGPLGARLDEGLRTIATERLDVRVLEPNETVVEEGQAVPGLVVVGVGALEIEQGGRLVERLGPGDFLFAAEVLGAGVAPSTARAGARGCVILYAARRLAHELLVTCPPLLEILAGM